MQALNREFELIRRSEQDTSIVPHRLQSLIDELDGRFGGFGDEPSAALAAAVERGDKSIDLTYRLPAPVGEAARLLGELLDEADTYCRAGEHLLTLVTPPECLRYRHWFLREFERQVQGLEPMPWTAFVDATTEPLGRRTHPTAVPDSGPRAGPRGLDRHPRGRDGPPGGRRAARPRVGACAPRRAHRAGRRHPAGRRRPLRLRLPRLGRARRPARRHRPGPGAGAMVSFRLSDAADRVLAISGVLERLDLEA